MGTFSNISSIFTDIANSLRSKMGTQDTFLPSEMAGAVNNIPTGAQVDEYVLNPYTNNYAYVAGLGDSNVADRVIQYNNIVEVKTWDITDASNLFNGNISDFSQYSGGLYFGNSVTMMGDCFYNCKNMNQSITVGSNVTTINGCFYNCSKLNCLVDFNIAYNLTQMNRVFRNCFVFNQPVTIPNSAISIIQCFENCRNFNQPITIPNNVKYAGYCFLQCYVFNQPVTISDGDVPISFQGLFESCWNFNQPVVIPSRANHVGSAFRNCRAFENDIYFKNSSNIRQAYAGNMVTSTSNSHRKNIWCDNATPFLGDRATNSITGQATTWDTMPDGNGYYNTAFNIYIYNNWSPS